MSLISSSDQASSLESLDDTLGLGDEEEVSDLTCSGSNVCCKPAEKGGSGWLIILLIIFPIGEFSLAALILQGATSLWFIISYGFLIRRHIKDDKNELKQAILRDSKKLSNEGILENFNPTKFKVDQIIEIPMKGKKESLNVSVSAGIFLYRLLDE